MDQHEFVKRLKAFRATMKCSQKEMAKHLGISPTTYNSWETARSHPSAPAIHSLTALGVNAHWLITGRGPMTVDDTVENGGAQGLDESPKRSAENPPQESPIKTLDYSLMEAAEQLREANLLPALLIGRRGRFELRWRLLKVLTEATEPIKREVLEKQITSLSDGPIDVRDFLAELEIGVEAGAFLRCNEGYTLSEDAHIRANVVEDCYSVLRLVIFGLGRNVIPAMKRRDKTGGISIWEGIVKDGRSFLRDLQQQTRDLLSQHSSERGDGVSVYLGASTVLEEVE